MFTALLRVRRPFIVLIHLALIALANYLAFWLRFDGIIPDWAMDLFVQTLPLLAVIRLLIFVPFRLYQGMWQYTSIWDFKNIVVSSILGIAVFYCAVQWGLGLERYPGSIYVLDTIVLIGLMGTIRLSRRFYRDATHHGSETRALIYGAGDAGERLVRALNHGPADGFKVVGFIDDNPGKTGLRIHGIRVFGGRQHLSRIMAEVAPHVVLLAMPSAKPRIIREMVALLEPHKVRIQTVPDLRSILEGQVEITRIRNLAVEDLLERAPVGLDVAPLRRLVEGKSIMVTGAGGSIGSELCRQIAALKPSHLVLFERYENNLFAIHNELVDGACGIPVFPVIGDVGDENRVEKVLQTFKPAIIFHAAAHKHVPLMESSPCEAVKNNVRGTRIVAQAAARCGVEQFIMISSDKAVNPTSTMGATKRVAELVVQNMEDRGRTKFMTVRFGNVLGSNGSVVPRFLEQIKAGGPVTVTHPDIRRYFMLIPEAVQLVLHAAAMGQNGAIYVLEMGEQIKIVDLARNLIRLSGLIPDEDIPISFVGLRPGEKLYEELVGHEETAQQSISEKILQVKSNCPFDPYVLMPLVALLEQRAVQQDIGLVMDLLCELVPTFKPTGSYTVQKDDRVLAGT